MIPEFGSPDFGYWGERQIQFLAEKGYRVSSNINLDTHCFSQVSNNGWRYGKAVVHDGSREGAQKAVDEAIYSVIVEAWTHHNLIRPSIRRIANNE